MVIVMLIKGIIMKALADNDLEVLRQVSNYFYKTNGIYTKKV